MLLILDTHGSGVYIGLEGCLRYCVHWKTLKASPPRKSLDDRRPATGRSLNPVHSGKLGIGIGNNDFTAHQWGTDRWTITVCSRCSVNVCSVYVGSCLYVQLYAATVDTYSTYVTSLITVYVHALHSVSCMCCVTVLVSQWS